MKTLKNINLKTTAFILVLATAFLGCERNLSDDIVLATFPTTAEIFTDAPVGLTDQFFRSFDPAQGANTSGFGVDDKVAYAGTSSIRIDVPGSNDPDGNFIGGIFEDRGAGRDLRGYDALTFWAKGSTSGPVLVGFGTDFDRLPTDPSYNVSATIQLGTGWKKYVIPMPDPSKLAQETGMFLFSAGGVDPVGDGPNGNELAWTFWIDELRFEKLGTVAQPRPAILNGSSKSIQSFNGAAVKLDGLTQTFNLSSGQDITTTVSPRYFTFNSSNTAVATVNSSGDISVLTQGNTTITASLNGVNANGSLAIQSLGVFTPAPTPTRNAANVISLFSDAYTNVPVDYYNGFWQPFQTTLSADFLVNGDNVLNYTNFNFVGTSFSNPTVNASSMTDVHLDIFIPGALDPGAQLKITIRDFGPDGVDGGGDDTNLVTTLTSANLAANAWSSIDISLALASKSRLGLIIYENNGTNLSNFYVDNLYFYEVPTAPTVAAPAPTLPAANVISMFSDQYTDVPVDTWNTGWSSAAFQDVTIAGNATKEYKSLSFNGIETVGTPINATSMTHISMDVWTPNITAFKVKLVDFLGNGFGNGDTEAELTFTPAQSQWVTLDIPLSSFTNAGMTALNDINQLVISCDPSGGGIVYIDNVYFHN